MPSTRRPQRPEQALHKAVAQFLTLALRPPVVWTTFPAGGGGKLRGAILRGMGCAYPGRTRRCSQVRHER